MWDLKAILSPRMRAKKPRNHAVLQMRGFLRLFAGDIVFIATLRPLVKFRLCRSMPQESPHFENGLISALFGPHVERMGSPKAPRFSWRDLSLDDCETRTCTSGLVIRDSPHQNANLQLHFGPRKNEGMAEGQCGRLDTEIHAYCDLTHPLIQAGPKVCVKTLFRFRNSSYFSTSGLKRCSGMLGMRS